MYLIGYWHFNVVVYKTVKVIRTDYALEPFQCTLYETILPELQHRVLFLNNINFFTITGQQPSPYAIYTYNWEKYNYRTQYL